MGMPQTETEQGIPINVSTLDPHNIANINSRYVRPNEYNQSSLYDTTVDPLYQSNHKKVLKNQRLLNMLQDIFHSCHRDDPSLSLLKGREDFRISASTLLLQLISQRSQVCYFPTYFFFA